VSRINACGPFERARFTVFPNGGHDCEQVIDLTGMGCGDTRYDPYDVDIYSWLLRHQPPELTTVRNRGTIIAEIP